MGYKKQIQFFIASIIVVLIFVAVIMFGNNICIKINDCFSLFVFGSPYQLLFLPLFSILLSLIPFLFLSEKVYYLWVKFAFATLPIIAFLIYISPTYSHSPIGFDVTKETTSMILSVVFVVVSWLIAVWHMLKNK